MEQERTGWGEALVRFVTVVFLALVAIVPIVGSVVRVQDVDPIYMRNLVERAARYGGTYYENAIHNRGTFEPFLYDLAQRVTSYDGYWFAISFIVAILAALLGFVAARTALFTGANRSVALAVGAAVYVQFALSGHGFSRVLYIRNITTVLLALTWVIALSERCWAGPRRSRAASAAVGLLLGLVVEQLLTSVLAGAVVGLVALALLYERRPAEERGGHLVTAIGAAVAGFLATPLWYLARGGFHDYWTGWWTYARYMGEGPGRSLRSQLGLGWDKAWEYHVHNPLVVVLVLAFLGTTWLLWGDLERRVRVVHVGLVAWLAAGWLELALSQRYSNHYYQVLAVPTALMGAALAGHAARAIAARRPSTRLSLGVPVVGTLFAIFLTGPAIFAQAVEDTRGFTGVADWAQERDKHLGGSDRSVLALLDLVSERNDGLLAWTFDPFVYTKYERVPATRFQWKFLFQGAIYLGRTSPNYVLPDTWKWFADDVAESRPVAFTETEPVDPDTPFDTYVRARFTPVYPGSAARLWLDRRVARELVDDNGDDPWFDQAQRIANSAWTVEGTGARWAAGPVPSGDDRLFLGTGPCLRVEGTVDVATPGVLPDLVFHLRSATHPEEEPQLLAIVGDQVGSGSMGLGALGFEALESKLSPDDPVRFAVVIGRQSAALVVNGQLVAAVRLDESVMALSLEARTSEVEVTDLTLGHAPSGGGCPR